MEPKIKSQQGFLLIVAVILIVIVGFIGSSLAYMYIGGTKSNTNILRSNEAFYIATSGLEIAKRDIIVNKAIYTCESINGIPKYTDAAFPPEAANPRGYFTVIGNVYAVNSQLSVSIDEVATIIPITDTSTLASFGFVSIAGETITYSGIQGNNLLNAKRGAASTTAQSHNIGTNVVQNMCTLTSTGQIPTTTNPEGKRIVQEQLMLLNQGYLAPGMSLPGSTLPAVIAVGDIDIRGDDTTISNLNADGIGCIVVTAGDTNTNQDPTFECSTSDTYEDTIWSNNVNNSPAPAIDINNFYNYFFDKSIGDLKASGYQASNLSQINNIITPGAPGYGNDVVWITGQELGLIDNANLLVNAPGVRTLIVEGNFNINSDNIIIGSIDAPVKLIVTGRLDCNKNTVINGFVYVLDNVDLHHDDFILNGAIASEKAILIKGGSTISFTSDIGDNLGTIVSVQSSPEIFN
jgi:Tfp pilus assembly protein PilX